MVSNVIHKISGKLRIYTNSGYQATGVGLGMGGWGGGVGGGGGLGLRSLGLFINRITSKAY